MTKLEQLKKEGWKYFNKADNVARFILVAITLISALAWGISLYSLVDPLDRIPGKTRREVMEITLIAVGLPIMFLQIVRLFIHITSPQPLYGQVGPDYDVCQAGPDALTKGELEAGAVGFVDYPCSIAMYKRVVYASERVRTSAYYATYLIFALFVFIFTSKTKLLAIDRSDPMLLHLVRLMLVFSLATITTSRFATHWVVSIFPLVMSRYLSSMMIGLASMVLVYVLSSVLK